MIREEDEALLDAILNPDFLRSDYLTKATDFLAQFEKDSSLTLKTKGENLQISQIISQINDGEFLFDKTEEDFTGKSVDGQNADLQHKINEQKFSFSYRSPFEDISSSKVIHVDVNSTCLEKPSFKTISEAIAEALPGDTIFIHPGNYDEAIVLDKALELKADLQDSRPGVTITSSTTDAIQLKANVGRIVNIRIKCQAPGDSYCVRTCNGCLDIYNCTLESDSAGTVCMEKDARIIAQACTLVTSTNNFTSLYPNSRSIFINCHFGTQALQDPRSKLLKGPAKPETKSLQEKYVLVGEKATGIFKDCNFSGITVQYQPDSKGMLETCTVSNTKNSVSVLSGAEVLIQGCDLTCIETTDVKEKIRCVDLGPGSLTVVRDSLLHSSNLGITARATADFYVTGCKIWGNVAGCRFYQGAVGTLVDNAIHDNKAVGIQVEAQCRIFISRCTIENNFNGISASTKLPDDDTITSEITIHRCKITKNETGVQNQIGIISHIYDSEFLANIKDITNQFNSVMDIRDSKFGFLEGQQQHDNNRHLCMVANGRSKAVIISSHFRNGYQSTIHASEEASIELQHCNFNSQAKRPIAGVQLIDKANLKAERCEFNYMSEIHGADFLPKAGAVNCSGETTCIISDCDFKQNTVAVNYREQAKGYVQNSRIMEGAVGVACTGATNVTLRLLFVTDISEQNMDAVSSGVYIQGSQQAQPTVAIHSCSFQAAGQKYSIIIAGCPTTIDINTCSFQDRSNRTAVTKRRPIAGILVKASRAQIMNSTFVSMSTGIHATDGSGVEIGSDTFTCDGNRGICIENRTNAAIMKCTFDNGMEMGVVLKNGSFATVEYCRFIQVKKQAITALDSNCQENGNENL